MKNNKGHILVVTIIFVFILLALGLILSKNVIFSFRTTQNIQEAIIAQNIAEAGIEKALWCMNQESGENCQGTYGDDFIGEIDVDFAQGKYTTSVESINENKKIITSSAYTTTAQKAIKIVQAVAHTGDAIVNFNTGGGEFDLSIQTGLGGLKLENNVIINGDIYAAKDVECANNTDIKGNVYVSGNGNKISGCDIDSDAHAYRIEKSDIGKDAYYIEINKTKVKGKEYPNTPPPDKKEFPLTEDHFDYFKSVAENTSIINGDLIVENNQSISLGPTLITGDFIAHNNVAITLYGIVYVMGNIEIYNNVNIKMSPDFEQYSTVMLSEGKLSLYNNCEFVRAGQGSYIIFISKDDSISKSNPAMNIENNADVVIFYAPYGFIDIANNVKLSSVFGYQIYAKNNAEIDYGEDLSEIKILLGKGEGWLLQRGTWNPQ